MNESMYSSVVQTPLSPLAEPEPEAEPEPGVEPEPGAEPEHEFMSVEAQSKQWALLWGLHYYTFGTVFFVLACYALYAILESHFIRSKIRRMTSIGACILAIKIMLLILGLTRAPYMFLYLPFLHDDGRPWALTKNILLNIAYPCLTGGFGLMCCILYEASRLKITSRSRILRSSKIVVAIILLHFVAVLISVTLMEFVDNFILMLLICHGFFVLWGTYLTVSFVYFAWKLLNAESKSSRIMAEIKAKESISYGTPRLTTVLEQQSNDGNKYNGKHECIPTLKMAEITSVESKSSIDKSIRDLEKNGTCHQIRDNTYSSRDSSINHIDIDHYPKLVNKCPSQELPMKSRSLRKISMANDEARKSPTHNKDVGDGFTNVSNASTKYSMNNSTQLGSPVFRTIRNRKTINADATKNTVRVKLTRKVLKIAALTSIFSVISVCLNTFTIIKGITFFCFDLKLSQTAVFIFNTCFRLLELGMAFTMASFTIQSMKSTKKQSIFKYSRKRNISTGSMSKQNNNSSIRTASVTI